MAYLNKEQYAARERNAQRRNADNAEAAIEKGMTEEQAYLITELCSLRHEIHCNTDSIIENDEHGYLDKLVNLNTRIRVSGFDYIKDIPANIDDFIDIDDIRLLEMVGEGVPKDTDSDEYDNWREDNYCRIANELEELNNKIEDYLTEIDDKYGTHFCPTGSLRV